MHRRRAELSPNGSQKVQTKEDERGGNNLRRRRQELKACAHALRAVAPRKRPPPP